MGKIATYSRLDEKHIVSIKYKNETRNFRLFSKRSALTLTLLVKNYPNGITTKDMRESHGIDDNKLFGELLDQSGFREFLKHIGNKDRLKVWKLELEELFNKTIKIKNEIIWFGIHEQTNLTTFRDDLITRQGLICNILGIPIYTKKSKKFLDNFRKVAIDHRRPSFKKGKNDIENLQLLSYYVNERKNQICAKCDFPMCEQCALAFPEKYKIIHPTKEDISELLTWREK